MPKYVDIHRNLPTGLTEVQFRQVVEKVAAAGKELGVRPINAYYNLAERKCICYLEGPNPDAVRRAHEGAGLDVEEIMEAKSVL